MAHYGINLRATASPAGVNPDAAGDTYSLGESYPTTRGGLTFGPTAVGLGMRDRAGSGDPQTAGIGFNGNSSPPIPFRFDLPNGPGTYDIRVAFGDATNAQTQAFRLADGTTVFKTVGPTVTGAGEFIDANGVKRTSRTDWATNNTALTRTFTNSYMLVYVGDPAQTAGDATSLAHVGLDTTADTTPPTITSTGTGTSPTFAANLSENSTAAFVTLTSNETATFSALGGADAALFTKTNVTGTSFDLAPVSAFDFENLSHANPFVVTFTATDTSSNATATQTVNVTITNVAELTAPTASATGPTQATVGVTTDTAATLYHLVLPAATAAPADAATLIANGAAVSHSVGSPGAQSYNLTGFTTNTAIKVHFAQAGSNVVSTASFTPSTLAIAGTALSAQTGTQGSALTWTGATPNSLITNAGNGSGSWSVTAGVGASGVTGCNATTGVPAAATLGTPGSYTITLTYTDSSTVPAAQTVTKTFGLTISASGGGGDTTPPTLTGVVTPSSITSTSATISWPAGSDNVAVVGYDYRVNGGAFIQLGNVLTYGLTGLTPSTGYTCDVRARDAAGNVSTPVITGSFTTSASSTATTVAITLVDVDGTTPMPSLTGLEWAFYDQAHPSLKAAPTAKGSGATTSSLGVLTVSIVGTALAVGATGWLEVTNSDGTVTQSPAARTFSGPVVVA